MRTVVLPALLLAAVLALRVLLAAAVAVAVCVEAVLPAVAALLLRVHSPQGQAFLDTAVRVLQKPGTQEMVTATLDNLALYFGDMRGGERLDITLGELEEDAQAYLDAPGDMLAEVLSACPDCAGDLQVMRLLSGLGYGVLRPVLRDTTAIGSLMRRKIEPDPRRPTYVLTVYGVGYKFSDRILMNTTDAFLAFPRIFLILLLVLSPHIGLLLLSFGTICSFAVLPDAFTLDHYLTVFSTATQYISNTLLYCVYGFYYRLILGPLSA